MMGGFLQGSGLLSSEFSARAEGEGPVTGIPCIEGFVKDHLIPVTDA